MGEQGVNCNMLVHNENINCDLLKEAGLCNVSMHLLSRHFHRPNCLESSGLKHEFVSVKGKQC